jgi:hypothetical protein
MEANNRRSAPMLLAGLTAGAGFDAALTTGTFLYDAAGRKRR